MLASLCLSFATINEYYIFTAATGTYTPVTGTTIAGLNVDDAISAAIPIGFTFVYGENNFTQVKVSTNGWIGLGTNFPNSTLLNALAGLNRIPVVAPLWDDLTMAAGNVQYLTTGTAPNRIFTIQYTEARWNFNSVGRFSFQVRLYENGKIDMVYGAATGANNLPSASIGINMAPGGSGWFYSITPTSSTASTTEENAAVNTFPALGTIYEFNPVIAQPNDLEAVSLSGEPTPIVGTQAIYTAQIRNRGTNPQSNYSVKLFNTDNVELASVNGLAIQPDQILGVNIPWTPTIDGSAALYARVALTTDQDPTNDQSPSLSIIVMPLGMVTVGDGNTHARLPFDMFYKNSLHQTIYYPAELGQTGTISAIALFNQFTTATLTDTPIKVWIGSTTAADLEAGWIPSTQLRLVYDGEVAMPAGANAIWIPFSTPFNYTGGNLVLMFNRPLDTQYYSYSDYFKCQTLGSNRARNLFSDSTNYDPAAPNGGTLSGLFPKTAFFMGPNATEPIFAITPAVCNYGDVNLGFSSNNAFTIYNAGAGTLTINSVTVSGDSAFTLGNLPVLPAALGSGADIGFLGVFAPVALGLSVATLSITDNLTRAVHQVSLIGTGVAANADLEPPDSLAATVQGASVQLNWQAPGGTTAPGSGFFDDFESYADFVIDFPPWTNVDLDQSSTYAITDHTWPNDYSAQAFIIWVPSATTPPYTGPGDTPHSGIKQAACFASFISPPNNDWLISPPVEIDAAANTLSFWARSLNIQYGSDRFKVGISTTGAAPADFTIISGAGYIPTQEAWTQYSYDLSAYLGQRIRFAIQCVTADAWVLLVDDVSVGPAPVPEPAVPSACTTATGASFSRSTGTTGDGNDSLREPARNLQGYRVYRDNSLIASINAPGITTYTDSNLSNGNYTYGITAVYNTGESYPSTLEVTVVNGVAGSDPGIPALNTQLLDNYPNPFNPETTIRFSLKEASSVSIGIYNVKGQLVKTLLSEVREAGNHGVLWNGRDDNGNAVSSGVYYYRMTAGSYIGFRKMLLLK